MVAQLLYNANLHPTMYLLIQILRKRKAISVIYLHPTMYLLIPTIINIMSYSKTFTSHYVSINSLTQ